MHQRNRSLAFGDYADSSTFSCPAVTTCPILCVANIDDCPTSCEQQLYDDANANVDYEVCSDGSCINANNGESSCGQFNTANPCQCERLPLACPKIIDDYSSCQSNYADYYADNASCLEYQRQSLPRVDFNAFAGGYLYMGTITGAMLLWCRMNRREGSVVGLECAASAVGGGKATIGAKGRSIGDGEGESKSVSDENESSSPYYNAETHLNGSEWTQTGYKSTSIGMCLCALIVVTHVAIQLLLLSLTMEYYKQQGAIVNMGDPMFYDDVQVLMAFEIVWTVGFLWCFFLKYPCSIRSLFLRRCLHEEATFIAVTAPIMAADTHYDNKWITRLLMRMGYAFRSALSFLYSDEMQTTALQEVTFCEVHVDPKTGSKHFYFRMRRYIYNPELKRFIPGCWNAKTNIGTWLDKSYMYCGLTTHEADRRLGIVGPNVLDLKKPTLFGSIKNEFSKPFYLYQNFMVWTWGPFWYYFMAVVYALIGITGGMVVAIFQYGSDMDLYRLMVTEGTVEVVRDGGTVIKMDQTDVVPGDVIKLSPGIAFFDMCVLQAKHILVDESALTGEVHPISKIPLDPAHSTTLYNTRTHKTSTISAGTTILECGGGRGISDGDLAVVTETGSFTAKGELLCDVLSYQRHKFKFDTEVKLILAILVVEAIMMLALVFRVIEDNWVYSWFYGMFVVSTVLPPLLPTVFVVSVGISCKRLQSKRITCTDSRSILVAGKVRQACFDKTGTLTKQGLDFVSALRGEELKNLTSSDGSGLEPSYHSSAPPDEVLMRGLAVCHTLNVSAEGTLIGAAVDRMGFAAVSKARLLDGKTVRFGSDTIEYMKRFEFNHHTMTQSVIIRHNNNVVVYVKGSPEAIGKLCRPETLPSNFHAKARQSARDGIYQIAIASTLFTSTKSTGEVTREDIERDLTFAGFINFQNQMKEETPQVIRELHEGNVACTMITGDNVLTGVYIARKARLIEPQNDVIIANSINNGEIEWVSAADDSSVRSPKVTDLESFSQATTLAMTGEVWQYLLEFYPSTAAEYAKYTKVFGRCTPNDKVSIVTTFVELGEICLMCGDGGNDCGALKAAHVGIALSDAEASVVAPFTSLDKSIASVTEVLKEGRCALSSALAAYKYMIMYGQIESINQLVGAYLHITFSEWCWVFMDGLWTISMAFALPLAKAAKKLSSSRPTASLLGPHTLSSACGVLSINILFLALGLAALWSQPWFQCRKWNSHDVSNGLTIGDNYETSVMFVISGYQYISSAAAYNFGYTCRAPWLSNHIFVFFFALWTIMHFTATLTQTKFSCIWRLNCDNDHVVRWVTSAEPEPIYNNFNTTVMPISFRVLLVVLMVANLFANCAWDYFVVNRWIPNFFSRTGMTDDSQHGVEDRFKASSSRVLV